MGVDQAGELAGVVVAVRAGDRGERPVAQVTGDRRQRAVGVVGEVVRWSTV